VREQDRVNLGESIMGLARLAELALADARISLTQYRVLQHLRRGRSIQSDLAFRLAVTKQSVTRVVDALVGKGYVTRRTDDDDRRRVIHAITHKGDRVLDDANARIVRFLEAVLADLDADDDVAAVERGIALFGRAMGASFERIRPDGIEPSVGRRLARS
jgi:DNA-binding MarR family transcriptional regulator